MNILDLPVELLQQILCTAISARGLERGLRLRLVNKTFSHQTLQTIHIYALLEGYYATLPQNKEIPLPFFTATYLERRVWSEPATGLPGLLKLREVAKNLAEETTDGRTQEDYVKLLCPLVIQNGSSNLRRLWSPTANASTLDDDIYVAALYTHTSPIVSRRLASGKGAASYSWLFGSPQRYAAEQGDEAFLGKLLEFSYADMVPRARWNLLRRVALAGRVEAVRFVYGFRVEEMPWDGTHKGVVDTPSREVWDFLVEKGVVAGDVEGKEGEGEGDDKRFTKALLTSALNGWADMSTFYLSHGADINGYQRTEYSARERPILEACKNGHTEVVKLLLDHKADLSSPALDLAASNGNVSIVRMLLEHEAQMGDALAKAAEKGYADVVQVLLEYGADVQRESFRGEEEVPVLAYAVRYEHERMFGLLVGPSKKLEDARVGEECVGVARERGLDSMVELLRGEGLYDGDRGVDIDAN